MPLFCECVPYSLLSQHLQVGKIKLVGLAVCYNRKQMPVTRPPPWHSQHTFGVSSYSQHTIGMTSLCVVQRSSKKLDILRWESKSFNGIKLCNLLRHIVISCQSQAAPSTALLTMAPMKVKPATQTYILHGRTLAIEASLQNYGIPCLTQLLMPWSMCCTHQSSHLMI